MAHRIWLLWVLVLALFVGGCGDGESKKVGGAEPSGGSGGEGGASSGSGGDGSGGDGSGGDGSGGEGGSGPEFAHGSVEACLERGGGELWLVTDAEAITRSLVVEATVTVEDEGISVETDADGCFSIEGVPAGPRSLRVVDDALEKVLPITVIGDATVNPGQTSVTLDEAVAAAEQELEALDVSIASPAWVMATRQPIPEGVTIGSAKEHLITDDADPILTVSAPSYFLYVDPFPATYFSHRTYFVLVDAETGEVEVAEADSWPVLNGYQHYASASFNFTSSDKVSGPPASFHTLERTGVVTQAQTTGSTFGLVIQGDRRANFKRDADKFEHQLELAGGEDNVERYTPPRPNEPMTNPAEDIRTKIGTLNEKMTAEDTLVVQLVSHGEAEGYAKLEKGYTQDGTVQHTYDQWRPASEVPWNMIKAGNIVIVIDTCHADAVAAEMKELFSGPAFADKKIVIIAGTAADEKGGAGPAGGYVTNAVLAALAGNFSPENVVAKFPRIKAEALKTSTEDEHMGIDTGNVRLGVNSVLFQRNVTPVQTPEEQSMILDQIFDGQETAELFASLFTEVPGGETMHHDGTKSQAPDPAQTILRTTNILFTIDDQAARARLFDDVFPCGVGPLGTTFCVDETLAPPGGEWILVLNQFEAPLPLMDPTGSFEYGVFFDADGIASNNFVPQPTYPYDPCAESDFWMFLYTYPDGVPYVYVTDTRAQIPVPPSATRFVFVDDELGVFVPRNLLDGADPTVRSSVFRHEGDYGATGPWSADIYPEIGTMAPVEVPGQAFTITQ